jgi:hypothetical protein
MRRALVDIAAEMLPEAARALVDYGFTIVGSAPNNLMAAQRTVRLVIGSDAIPSLLPEECDIGWRVISVQMVKESHGEQSITKITDVSVIGRPNLSLAG